MRLHLGIVLSAALLLCSVCASPEGMVRPVRPQQMTLDIEDLRADLPDTHELLLKRSITPALMIGVGSLMQDYGRKDDIRFAGSLSSPSGVGDYIQFTPLAIMMASYLSLSISGERDWEDAVRLSFTGATGFMTQFLLVNAIKYTACRERPDLNGDNSFPSGHSSTAFFLATMLHKEYGKGISPWFSVAGYGFAAATAMDRVWSDNHWITDVTASAGIGIFSAEFVCWLNDLIFKYDAGMHSYDSCWPDDSEWAFGLYTGYNFDRFVSAGDIVNDDLCPGYSLGVNGTRRVNDWLGAELSFDLTQMRWKGGGQAILPDGGALPMLKTVNAGMRADIPVVGALGAFAALSAGMTFGEHYSLGYGELPELFEWNYPDAFDARCRIGLSISASQCSSILCFGGLDYYAGYGLSAMAGTSFNLVF